MKQRRPATYSFRECRFEARRCAEGPLMSIGRSEVGGGHDVGLPAFCCAIIWVSETELLLESRPLFAWPMPAQLACFGGNREDGETPLDCIRRELHEELRWRPRQIWLAVRLYVGNEPKVWFYEAKAPRRLLRVKIEPGFQVAVHRADSLPFKAFSTWHAAALRARLLGQPCVHLPG